MNPLRCGLCGVGYTYPKALETHLRLENCMSYYDQYERPVAPCPWCDRWITTDRMKWHCVNMHGIRERDVPEPGRVCTPVDVPDLYRAGRAYRGRGGTTQAPESNGDGVTTSMLDNCDDQVGSDGEECEHEEQSINTSVDITAEQLRDEEILKEYINKPKGTNKAIKALAGYILSMVVQRHDDKAKPSPLDVTPKNARWLLLASSVYWRDTHYNIGKVRGLSKAKFFRLYKCMVRKQDKDSRQAVKSCFNLLYGGEKNKTRNTNHKARMRFCNSTSANIGNALSQARENFARAIVPKAGKNILATTPKSTSSPNTPKRNNKPMCDRSFYVLSHATRGEWKTVVKAFGWKTTTRFRGDKDELLQTFLLRKEDNHVPKSTITRIKGEVQNIQHPSQRNEKVKAFLFPTGSHKPFWCSSSDFFASYAAIVVELWDGSNFTTSGEYLRPPAFTRPKTVAEFVKCIDFDAELRILGALYVMGYFNVIAKTTNQYVDPAHRARVPTRVLMFALYPFLKAERASRLGETTTIDYPKFYDEVHKGDAEIDSDAEYILTASESSGEE